MNMPQGWSGWGDSVKGNADDYGTTLGFLEPCIDINRGFPKSLREIALKMPKMG
jgi:hypothetical protein